MECWVFRRKSESFGVECAMYSCRNESALGNLSFDHDHATGKTDLLSMHAKLCGLPTDYTGLASLALQRAGHNSPAEAAVHDDRLQSTAHIEWKPQDSALLQVLDANRVTEDGAEAVALAFASCSDGWTAKRRLQRTEHADWLLYKDRRWLALEVSGTADGDPFARLAIKKSKSPAVP
jgi:hypothetical protein